MPEATLDRRRARRLALCCAGLLKPLWLGLPSRASGGGKRARCAALRLVNHFGYLQLDTVSVAGARSHALVMLSRYPRMHPTLPEDLLRAGQPLFEYWGHEASWLPLDLYPAFAFRRRRMRARPGWRELLKQHSGLRRNLLRRIESEGALRSADLEGEPGGGGWWDFKAAKRVANALWSCGELAIAERRNFLRSYDLVERVIPEPYRANELDLRDSLRQLLMRALAGHGWATRSTLASTWRLRHLGKPIDEALRSLEDEGRVRRCRLELGDRSLAGWIRSDHLELAERLARARPRRDRGALLSPFDPVLWDRGRVQDLFGFHHLLEIFKPAHQRRYGYYCLPVLAGDRLVARVDLKAHRTERVLEVRNLHYETEDRSAAAAVTSAIERYAASVDLEAPRSARG